MSPRALASAAVCALLLTSCGQDEIYPDVYLYGEVDAATYARIADAIPHMPASPWPCVREVHIRDTGCSLRIRGETVTHAGCYYPDSQIIISRLDALHHELAHAAAECALGHPDSAHASNWWRDVDGVR